MRRRTAGAPYHRRSAEWGFTTSEPQAQAPVGVWSRVRVLVLSLGCRGAYSSGWHTVCYRLRCNWVCPVGARVLMVRVAPCGALPRCPPLVGARCLTCGGLP